MKKKAMPRPVASIRALLKRLERTLLAENPFQVIHPTGAAVQFKRLRLDEVRYNKKQKALSLIVTARFDGSHGPHRVTLTPARMEALGFSDMSLGMGSAPYDKGYVDKGMTLKVLPEVVHGKFAEQLAELTSSAVLDVEKAVQHHISESPAYQSDAQKLAMLQADIVRLTRQANKLQGRLEKYRASARTVAQAKAVRVVDARRGGAAAFAVTAY